MNETITLCLEIIFWLALFIVFYTYLAQIKNTTLPVWVIR